jgi:hypothetical protein
MYHRELFVHKFILLVFVSFCQFLSAQGWVLSLTKGGANGGLKI